MLGLNTNKQRRSSKPAVFLHIQLRFAKLGGKLINFKQIGFHVPFINHYPTLNDLFGVRDSTEIVQSVLLDLRYLENNTSSTGTFFCRYSRVLPRTTSFQTKQLKGLDLTHLAGNAKPRINTPMAKGQNSASKDRN